MISMVAIGGLAKFSKGSGLAKSDLIVNGAYPCIHYGELFTQYGPVIDSVISRTNRDLPIKSVAGDVLMPTSDVTPRGLAKASAIQSTGVGLGGDVLIIRIDRTRADSRFLAYAIRNDANQVLALVRGSTVYHLYAADMRHFEVPLLPVIEQKRIADALSDNDALIAALERLITKKQAIKQGMMQELLTGRTRLPGFAGAWRDVELGDMAEIVSGGTPSSGTQAYWDGGIPWATPTDITNESGRYLRRTARTISASGLEHSAARLLPAGSLLLCTRATVGEVKIAAVPAATNQGFKSLVPKADVSSEFLYYKIVTLRDALTSKGSGSTFLEVSKRDVGKLLLQVPDADEQVAVAKALADADEEIDLLRVRLNKARDIKQGMMQELLTGRTRLPVQEAGA